MPFEAWWEPYSHGMSKTEKRVALIAWHVAQAEMREACRKAICQFCAIGFPFADESKQDHVGRSTHTRQGLFVCTAYPIRALEIR